jgi:hypothetical protein
MKGWRWLPWSVLVWCCVNLQLAMGAKPPTEIAKFISAKRDYVERVAKALNAKLPPEVGQLFDTAAQGNWRSVSNLFDNLEKRFGPNFDESPIPRELWYVLQEVGGAYEVIGFWDPKYTRQFADEVFKVVATNAVYFGGTDPGRFVITAMSASHEQGKPFFTITQNQLAATPYLEYVKRIYDSKLKLPSKDDLTQVFQDYLADAQRRMEHDRKFPNEPKQVKPGEDVKVVDNRVQASGRTAVMAINGGIAKRIFDDNPDREFYIEESIALEWMYPHVTPAGPIFKLNRKKVETLPATMLATDRAYWDARLKEAIGWQPNDETTIASVCAFAEKVFGQQKLDDFKGDRAYLKEPDVQRITGKLRSATAGLYAWRAKEANSAPDRRRMLKEADLAFMQAYVLAPANSEIVWHFANYLVENLRKDDALQFIRAAAKFNPKDEHTTGLLRYVEDWDAKSR